MLAQHNQLDSSWPAQQTGKTGAVPHSTQSLSLSPPLSTPSTSESVKVCFSLCLSTLAPFLTTSKSLGRLGPFHYSPCPAFLLLFPYPQHAAFNNLPPRSFHPFFRGGSAV